MRNICVCLEFLTEERCAAIRDTAEKLGFAVRFFTIEQQAEALAFVPDCEVLFAHDAELVRSAKQLKWFHCSWAGVDAYCRDDTLFAAPDCLLTNSHSYGTTIAEHVIMVTLMLLRRMVEYQSAMAEKKGSITSRILMTRKGLRPDSRVWASTANMPHSCTPATTAIRQNNRHNNHLGNTITIMNNKIV